MEAPSQKTSVSRMKILFSIVLAALICAGCTEGQSTGSASTMRVHAKSLQPLKPRAKIILEQALNGQNAYLRSAAVEITVETGQKDFLPHITRLTTDPIVPVRFNATVALGDMRCFSCEQIVQKLLDDPDMNVQVAAAYSMVKLNHPHHVETLRTAAKSPNQTVRANAALLLGKLGNPGNISLLYEVLQSSDSEDKVRLQAVESLARLGDDRMYRTKLWALLISKYADDRVIGIRGMGALNTVDSRNAIISALKDDLPEVRLVAAEQLARLGDNRGEEIVYNYFIDKNTDLNKLEMASQTAVMAIGYMNSNRLNGYLPQALNSQSPYIQLMAAQSVLLQVK